MHNGDSIVFHNGLSELLYEAALQGNTECVKQCLCSGADVNYIGRFNKTPLFVACENNQLDTVRILVSHNANMDITNRKGKKPFDIASEKQYHEIVEILLDQRIVIAFPHLRPFQQVMIDSTNPSAQ